MDLTDVIIFLFALYFLNLWWRRYSSSRSSQCRMNIPPGPKGLPLVGNLLQVIFQGRHFVFIMRDLRKKYGPIFTMQMGQRTMIIVTDEKLIHEALVQRGPTFASRPPDSPIRLIFSVGKCAINSAEYGSLWRTLRRNFVTELVTPTRVKQCSWIRTWAMENHMKRIQTDSVEKGFVEVMSQCRLTICSILICLCFGAKISEQKIKNIENVLKDVMLITSPKLPDFLPVFTPLFRRQVREARELRKTQLECLVPLIKNRRAFVDAKESANEEMVSPIGAAYVDSLFSLKAVERCGELRDEEIVTLCSEIVSAGTDTSATTLEWALLHLVTDQNIQEKLYEEVVGVVGENGVVEEDDVAKMPYLEAIVKETLRRHPPGHFLLSHAAVKDTELGGYDIPAGAYVEFYTAWVTENPEIWSDPGKFRPERFLAGGDGVNADWTGTRGVTMLPFGAGRRICPAWSLGILHINLMLARMVHSFKWIPLPDSPPDPTETYAFTVVMKNSLKARIQSRT
ncbi:PREDICTED: cytochrome P450 77A3 [Brassica oleracea var. oleracea]|uniref:Cytochrome P450 n=1 Tax=Brassica oleracea var. oleracea TaxID=109376 RepID=A0A0D3DXY3_BRAOL|nr:PREDICTED: cytochrome P450 77A3 [Brassica oleracea var. oleracea]